MLILECDKCQVKQALKVISQLNISENALSPLQVAFKTEELPTTFMPYAEKRVSGGVYDGRLLCSPCANKYEAWKASIDKKHKEEAEKERQGWFA